MRDNTRQILNKISHNLLFSQYDIRFVGGTALSYHINHRLSEDLDFAMLEICHDAISETMDALKAIKIEHSQIATQYALNDGEEMERYYVKFLLEGVKIEFFVPPFNLLEKEIWNKDKPVMYESSKVQISSLETILYMKTMAFWNRKKYRDLFDIHYTINNIKGYTINKFIDNYLQYHKTHTPESLHKLLGDKGKFFHKKDDEELSRLVETPKPYEFYRNAIHEKIYSDIILPQTYQ